MTAVLLHGCLQRYPGAALELDAEGIVRHSNGRLDALIGKELTGISLQQVLDDSSQDKWRRILSTQERVNPACSWEMVFTTPESLELRSFLAIWSGSGAEEALWLLEYSADPKLELLYGELSELHREVVHSQRELRRERTRIAAALAQAQAAIRSRDEVLAIVSHDLRSPLHTITMAASLLEMEPSADARADQLAIISRTAERMNRLISDLLDASAAESGAFSVEMAQMDLALVLREGVDALREQASRKGVTLRADLPAELPKLTGDRHRLVQVVTNILGNAMKFTPGGGEVTVRAQPGEGDVEVAVSDTGPGIPEEELPRIFDRFWHTSRTRRGGAGLGLAIAKGIVEAHGGHIWVESTSGAGSTFSFTLPTGGPSEPDLEPARR